MSKQRESNRDRRRRSIGLPLTPGQRRVLTAMAFAEAGMTRWQVYAAETPHYETTFLAWNWLLAEAFVRLGVHTLADAIKVARERGEL